MENRAQRWGAGGTRDQGEYVQAGDGAGVRRRTRQGLCSELHNSMFSMLRSKG